MELAIKAFLLGACFFTGIYIIAKLSDKLQKNKPTEDSQTIEEKDTEESTKEK